MPDAQELGIIGEVQENGLPVIYKFVDEYPSAEVRATYRWVTVISWQYDGSSRNGMPPDDINQRMIALEHVMEESLDNPGHARHAYSRTGNHLKELVYYVADRDAFMSALNDALATHPRYPIDINFYEDPEWQDFQVILKLFKRGG